MPPVICMHSSIEYKRNKCPQRIAFRIAFLTPFFLIAECKWSACNPLPFGFPRLATLWRCMSIHTRTVYSWQYQHYSTDWHSSLHSLHLQRPLPQHHTWRLAMPNQLLQIWKQWERKKGLSVTSSTLPMLTPNRTLAFSSHNRQYSTSTHLPPKTIHYFLERGVLRAALCSYQLFDPLVDSCP